MRPLAKYLLLQIPGWLIAAAVLVASWRSENVSGSVAISLLLLWVGKDLVFYPFLRAAYLSDVPTGAQRLLGQSAVVRRRLSPIGYVQVRGELWRAEVPAGHPPVPVASSVRVVAAKRLTLTVEALPDDAG